jgi:hypothetical protein
VKHKPRRHSQHIKEAHELKLQEAIRNRIETYSSSVCNASSGLMHLEKELYEDVTDLKRVEDREEFFTRTSIRHLMFDTGETSRRNDLVHASTKVRLNTLQLCSIQE